MNIYELENLFLYCQILNLDNLAEIIRTYKLNKNGTETITETMRRLALNKNANKQ